MDNRNNLGRQYTTDPHFGTTYPNTQYKGYKDHESAPFGASSGEHRVPSVNQYGHTSQYQGNNPGHPEDRLSNVRSHGGGSYPMNFGSPTMGMGGSGYAPSQAIGVGGYGYTSIANPGMGSTDFASAQTTGMSGSGSTAYTPHGTGYSPTQYQATPVLYQSMIDPSGSGSSFRHETPFGTMGATTKTDEPTVSVNELNGQTTTQFNDRDRLQDLLSSEKYLAEGYNVSTFEATDPELHNTLRGILNETHQNRETLHQTMEQRGWYKTDSADQQAVAQAHNQFKQNRHQLPF